MIAIRSRRVIAGATIGDGKAVRAVCATTRASGTGAPKERMVFFNRKNGDEDEEACPV